MGYVSDEAVNSIIAELSVNRDKRRSIQRMSKEELQRYLVHLYREGFEAGADAIRRHLEETRNHVQDEGIEEVRLDWEDVLAVIAGVKGVGPEILSEIDNKLKETY